MIFPKKKTQKVVFSFITIFIAMTYNSRCTVINRFTRNRTSPPPAERNPNYVTAFRPAIFTKKTEVNERKKKKNTC